MRVRFAPSPTGALHIGGARTALYNWLLARGSRGSLLLRIEDTDKERSTEENVQQILDALAWLGIDWDDGPLFQTSCAQRHAEVLQQLLESGHAYRCEATAEDVKSWKESNGNRGFRGQESESGAVRLRVPDQGNTVVKDIIRGDTVFEHLHIDDPVIARADGSVLYNFAVAVDDLDGEVTHVVRGEDHLSNTPKQILVLQALGATPPVYAHLPLLHGPDGKKLSKRHGAASVQELRDRGYLPQAVINYISLLGWGYDESTTFFSVSQLQEFFSLEKVSKSPAVFDEQKLRWMNGHYLRELSVDQLADCLVQFLGRSDLDRELLLAVVAISREKIQTLADFWPLAGFFFDGPIVDQRAWDKNIAVEGGAERLAKVLQALEAVADFGQDSVEQALRALVDELDCKPKQVFQPLRVALAGTTVSPGIFESVAVLGPEQTFLRIKAALDGINP